MTACAACRASDKKRVLCHHTMSARSRTAAGSRERGRPRAVPGVLCEKPLPQQTLAQSHSHPFLRSLPWSLFCVSHDISSVPCSNSWDVFRCGCHSFHRIFGSIFRPHADSGKPRATIARPALVSFHKTHEFIGLFYRQPITSQCQRHDGATAAALCRAATRLLYICQDTHILTLQWALYAG